MTKPSFGSALIIKVSIPASHFCDIWTPQKTVFSYLRQPSRNDAFAFRENYIMSRDLFRPNGKIYRGNLHGHCTHSDGRNEAADVVRIYRKAGYDFTCLSDHY